MDKRTLKPSEVNPNFLKGIEQRYGKINPEYDFFSQNLDTYFKYEGTDSNTGSVEHKIIKLASFADSLKEFYQALLAIESLLDTDMGKVDPQIRDIAFETRKIFNNFRTHIRNKYPEQYNTIKDAIKEVSMTGGGTAGASVSIKIETIQHLPNIRLILINLERCKLNIQRSCYSHEEI
jgi:hypothetical protein